MKELIDHVQLLLDDTHAYPSALELHELDGEAWAEIAHKLLEAARAELNKS